MDSNLILLIIGVVAFLQCLLKNEKTIIKLLIFTLPVRTLFESTMIPIGLNGILIWAVWFAFLIKHKKSSFKLINWNVITAQLNWLYYIITIGILIGYFDITILDTYTKSSKISQIFHISLNLITLVFFIKILVNYRENIKFQNTLKLVFTASIFIQILPLIAHYFGVLNNFYLLSFVTFEDNLIGSEVARFAGLLGDYELIVDYCLIVIAIAFINVLNKRYVSFSIMAMLISIGIGIYSGTRSFLVILPLFFLVFYFIGFYYNLNRNKLLISSICIGYFSYFLFINYSSDIIVFERLKGALEIYSQSGNLNDASNRHFDKSLKNLLLNSNLSLGNGSLEFNQIKGDEMVSHNVLLHVYAKYGIVGLFLLVLLFARSIYFLFKLLSKSKLKIIKTEATVYLSLIICLFIQQMKISILRYQSTMLIYCFLFILIYYFLYQNKIVKKS